MSFQYLLVFIAFPSGMLAFFLTPRSKRWKGRHISRPLVKRLGPRGARVLWKRLALVRLTFLIWAIWGGPDTPWIALFVVDVARDVDDWLYSDDDDERRKDRFRARVRLRMPAPVRLRAVERWSGA